MKELQVASYNKEKERRCEIWINVTFKINSVKACISDADEESFAYHTMKVPLNKGKLIKHFTDH